MVIGSIAAPNTGMPIAALPEPPASPAASFWTSLRFFSLGRLALALLLMLPLAVGSKALWADIVVHQRLYAGVAFAYLLAAIAMFAVASRWHQRFQLQLLVQGLVDPAAIVLLMHAAGGPRSGLGVLAVAAVAGVAVLSTARMSAFFAATATLLLLGESAWRVLDAQAIDPTAFVPAGVIGTACFVTAALVNRLATRLAAQEALARARGSDLRGQLALTQLVVAQLPHGVVVFDRTGKVRASNPAAQALLGGGAGADLTQRIFRAAQSAHAEGVDLGLEAPGLPGRHRVRVRALRPEGETLGDTVVLIDDLRELEERAQQLKLASMGRLSASIAHEIRNPLAAIRHANGLLAEQVDEPRLQRLSRIVEDNTVRIDRVVQDVLAIARRERPALEPIDLPRFLGALVPEFVLMSGADRRRVEMSFETAEPMLFDPGQLRQVLVNLLGNALRYASSAPGAVRIEWRPGEDHRLELRITDDGPGLPPGMIEHVFEPFFTTESRGTGLGLYLARELCTANRATLGYEPPSDDGGRGAFVITAAGRSVDT